MPNPSRMPSHLASRALGACALALALLSPAYCAPVLQMSAATSAAGIDLTVSAQDVADLYAYQFTLNFDPGLLNGLAATEGAFLSGAGSTFFYPGEIDNTAGSVTFLFNTLVGAIGGVDGSGDLATFSFDVVQGGFASFSLSDVFLLDSAGGIISVDTQDLVVQVGEVPEPGSLWLAALGLVAVLGGRSIKPRRR